MSGNQQQDVRNPKPLTLADAQAIADPLAAPFGCWRWRPCFRATWKYRPARRASRVSIIGVTPDYAAVANETVTEGEFITEEHMLGALGGGRDRPGHRRQAVRPHSKA